MHLPAGGHDVLAVSPVPECPHLRVPKREDGPVICDNHCKFFASTDVDDLTAERGDLLRLVFEVAGLAEAELTELVGAARPNLAPARKEKSVRFARNGLGDAHVLEDLDYRRRAAIHLVAVTELAKLIAPERIALAVLGDTNRVAC